MAWGIEEQAENLRRAAPEFWHAFLAELEIERNDAVARLIIAPHGDVQWIQGEARALSKLLDRLRDANKTVERIKAGAKRND